MRRAALARKGDCAQNSAMSKKDLIPDATLERIAAALERLSPPPLTAPDLAGADGFVWAARERRLAPVADIAGPRLELLQGVDAHRDDLLRNTRAFAQGLPANNALLWGARGTGKSALVKAVFRQVASEASGLKLVEIHRDEIDSLNELLRALRTVSERVVLFCDDLSFENTDAHYKALKAALEGGVEGRPENVLFYATSNRKFLTPRMMAENQDHTAIMRGEAGQETTSLADRFGLSLGFYVVDQAGYLDIVTAYAHELKLPVSDEDLHRQALAWAAGRGGRSGRVAWQFIQDLSARLAAGGAP